MGQQQLLLLVLGIVIVGLAVVVGIQAFSENQIKANADAQVNDAIRIASDAQAWVLKPQAFGGGNGEFTNATLAKLGYEVLASGSTNCTAGDYENLNGCYEMVAGANGIAILSYNPDTDVSVLMTVTGTTPDAITTNVSTGVTARPSSPTAP